MGVPRGLHSGDAAKTYEREAPVVEDSPLVFPFAAGFLVAGIEGVKGGAGPRR